MEEFDVFYESDTSNEDDDEQPNYLRKRYIRDYANRLEHYEDHEFSRRYRFSKAVVIDVLLPLTRTKLEKHCNRGLPIPPLIQLLTALRFYASNSFQMVHGNLRWLSQASVSRIVKNVSIAFAEQLKQFICFPRSDTGIRRNTAKFYTIAYFPSLVGCLDCTYIPISNPGGENAEVFRCRKGYFSLNVQVVCGPNMEIMDIVVRHPGSTHDSVTFDRSAVRARFEAGEFRSVLLGDNGYPC
ncbi:putative nuclease HARBI1, partial [Cephus cinctus]|uniref:Putative nuclease HARBI1 n=1 Tax=Cephus cinctus TaxID=211228 RepID=A0AAJ7C6B6_CEPCN